MEIVGENDGDAVGESVGFGVLSQFFALFVHLSSSTVGVLVGNLVGAVVGRGTGVGFLLGLGEGAPVVGVDVGDDDGLGEGIFVGALLGNFVGVPGTTGHDFANYYDHSNKTIVWYGKPKSHSGQPTFKKLLDGSLTPHFFARWDNKDKMFTHLGVGKIVSFKDGHPCLDGKGNQVTTIELKLNIDDSGEIIPIENQTNVIENREALTENNFAPKSSFLLEKHLEDYIIKNWKNIELNQNYDIHKENNKLCTQYQTGSGPLDILAISKDKNEFLVIELKKGRASDIVLGQIQRYMGHIKKKSCKK